MPSLIVKRGKERYRASVAIQGITRQQLFPDRSKKSYKAALIWENDIKKELQERLSRTNSVSFKIGQWANEYLEDAQNRFAKQTFDEKRAVFKRFFKETPVQPDWLIEKITQTICRKYLSRQFKQRSGYSANKERKNLGTAWNWGRDNLEEWPKISNPFLVIQAILRHKNPNTTARYLRTLRLEQTREASEEGLKGPAQVIQFEQISQKQASGNN